MEQRPLIDFSILKKKKQIVDSSTTTQEKQEKPEKIQQNPSQTQSKITIPTSSPSQVNENSLKGSEEEYRHLLDRIIDIISEKNPEMLGMEKKFQLPPIQIQKVTNRSAWTNFKEVCDLLKRPLDHACSFFIKELGTEASISGESQLFLKGKYNSTKIENLIAKYVKEYVRCPNCKSFDTVLNKNNNTRLVMLECNFCSTKKAVAKQS